MNSALALLSSLLLQASTPKLLLMPLKAGEGASAPQAQSLTDAFAAQVRKRPQVQVLTPADVEAVLGLERQKQLLGAGENSNTLAEVGSAMGAERLLTGSVAHLGKSWLVQLQVIDVAKVKVVAQAERRLAEGTLDAVLDVLPAMAEELVGVAPAKPQPTAAAPVADAPKATAVPGASSSTAEVAATLTTEQKAKVKVLADAAKKHFIVVEPFAGTDGAFFAGTADKLFAQYVHGGGSSGTESFSLSFWEPRSSENASLEFSDKKGFAIWCSGKERPYTALSAKEAEAFLKKASLFAPRWQRQVAALARDEAGVWYVADLPRKDGWVADDARLFVGKKGKVAQVKVDSVEYVDGRLEFETPQGRLVIPAFETAKEATWFDPQGAKRVMGVVDRFQQRAALYTSMGVYPGEQLGTACDPAFAP